MSTYKVTFEDWSGKSHTLAGDSPEAIAREMSVRGYAGPPIPLRRTLDGSIYGLVSADLFEHTPEELERRRTEVERAAAAEAARHKEERHQDDRARAFLADLEAVCVKHGLSLAHEDGHGSFLVTKWNENDSRWLAAARRETEAT